MSELRRKLRDQRCGSEENGSGTAGSCSGSVSVRKSDEAFFEKNRILIIAVVIVIVLAIAGGLFAAISGSKDVHMKGDATFEISVGKTADSSDAAAAP